MFLWNLEFPGTDLLPQLIWAELNVPSHKPPVSPSQGDSLTVKNIPSFHEFFVFDALLLSPSIQILSENIHINSTWWQLKYSNRILQLKTVVQVKVRIRIVKKDSYVFSMCQQGLILTDHRSCLQTMIPSKVEQPWLHKCMGGSDQVCSFSPQSPQLFHT